MHCIIYYHSWWLILRKDFLLLFLFVCFFLYFPLFFFSNFILLSFYLATHSNFCLLKNQVMKWTVTLYLKRPFWIPFCLQFWINISHHSQPITSLLILDFCFDPLPIFSLIHIFLFLFFKSLYYTFFGKPLQHFWLIIFHSKNLGLIYWRAEYF